jgi:predicted Fe-Mo cluster-binding NifX family protein
MILCTAGLEVCNTSHSTEKGAQDMNIAITIWGNRISPVFDASKTLLIVKIDNGEIVDQVIMDFQAARFDFFQKSLQEMNVQFLICGAICKIWVGKLEGIGIEVVPFLTGEVERILEQFIKGDEITEFAMPGCRAGRCCRKTESTERKIRQVLKAGCEY